MQRILFIGVVLFFAISMKAQMVTDRPDQTESSAVVGKGVLQVETGFTYETTDLDNGDRAVGIALPNALWRLGISDRFELRVVTQPEVSNYEAVGFGTQRDFGLADLELGFKVNLLEPKKGNTEIGFLAHLVVPTGTDGISNEVPGVISKLAVTHTFGESHSVGYNLGYDYVNEVHQLFYSLAWGVGLSEKVGVYLEVYGTYNEADRLGVNFDTGFTYLINQNVQLDYSFGLGLAERMNYHSIGCSFRLGNGVRNN